MGEEHTLKHCIFFICICAFAIGGLVITLRGGVEAFGTGVVLPNKQILPFLPDICLDFEAVPALCHHKGYFRYFDCEFKSVLQLACIQGCGHAIQPVDRMMFTNTTIEIVTEEFTNCTYLCIDHYPNPQGCSLPYFPEEEK